jgi:hypothetical protein
LCYKGFLNGYNATYGQTLIGIANGIKAQGARNPSCFAGVQDYCVSTQLTDGSYLCVDKNGVVGTTKCVISTTVCE